MTNHTDVMVATRQGSYYRPNAQQHMTDGEWAIWYINHSGGRVRTKKARREHTCKTCGLPILKGSKYYAIFYGLGLGSLKFPDKIHLIRDCIKEYADKRREMMAGWNPLKGEWDDG